MSRHSGCGDSSHHHHRDEDVLSEFQVDEPRNMPRRPVIPLTQDPQEIARITLGIDDFCNAVWLSGTVGWYIAQTQGTTPIINSPTVIFRIFRNSIAIQNQLFATRDSGNSPFVVDGVLNFGDNFQTTSFNHVDRTAYHMGECHMTYILTAELATPEGQRNTSVIGPITFIGAEINPGGFHR